MFVLKEYESDKCLIKTEYSDDKTGIDYAPVNYDLLVFKCGFEFVFDEIALDNLMIDLRISNLSIDAMEKHFQSIGTGDVSVMFFRKTRYLAENCFPVIDQGRNYIMLTCMQNGDDIYVYKPDFTVVENDGVGICQVPLSIEVRRLIQEKKGLFGSLFGSKDQDEYAEYEFKYDLCSEYCDGDIYYTVEGFYPPEDNKQLIIPITKKALDNRYICINCSGDSIRFGCKNRVNMIVKE